MGGWAVEPARLSHGVNGLNASFDMEFGQYVFDVELDGALADVELFGNVAITMSSY